MSNSDPPGLSNPPAVKVVKAWGAVVENCVVLGFIGTGFLMGKISPEVAGGAAAVVLGLITIPQILGKGPGAHVGVLSFAPKMVAAAIAALSKHG